MYHELSTSSGEWNIQALYAEPSPRRLACFSAGRYVLHSGEPLSTGTAVDNLAESGMTKWVPASYAAPGSVRSFRSAGCRSRTASSPEEFAQGVVLQPARRLLPDVQHGAAHRARRPREDVPRPVRVLLVDLDAHGGALPAVRRGREGELRSARRIRSSSRSAATTASRCATSRAPASATSASSRRPTSPRSRARRA